MRTLALLIAALLVCAVVGSVYFDKRNNHWEKIQVFGIGRIGIAYAANIPENSGIENVYIMKHGAYNPSENLCNNENIYDVIEYSGDTGILPYEVPFDIVVTVKIKSDAETSDKDAAKLVAYVNPDNMKVELITSGDINFADNSVDDNEHAFDNNCPFEPGAYNPGSGTPDDWARVNVVFDNYGNGFRIRAGGSFNYSITLWVWA